MHSKHPHSSMSARVNCQVFPKLSAIRSSFVRPICGSTSRRLRSVRLEAMEILTKEHIWTPQHLKIQPCLLNLPQLITTQYSRRSLWLLQLQQPKLLLLARKRLRLSKWKIALRSTLSTTGIRMRRTFSLHIRLRKVVKILPMENSSFN